MRQILADGHTRSEQSLSGRNPRFPAPFRPRPLAPPVPVSLAVPRFVSISRLPFAGHAHNGTTYLAERRKSMLTRVDHLYGLKRDAKVLPFWSES